MSSALGHPRVHLRVTNSTNERARALAIAGAPHGTLVTASEQTAGRGRQGRRWSAPPASALLASFLLRGERDRDGATARPPALLSLIAAVAVCDVVGAQAQIKWPNDVVLIREGRLAKLAGILVEGRPQDGWAVLGIGLNVAVRLEDMPAQLRATAATLGEPRAAIEVRLEQLIGALERRLGEPAQSTLETYRARDILREREITWAGGRGRAQGIDAAGRLVVGLEQGGEAVLEAGEVHLQLRG